MPPNVGYNIIPWHRNCEMCNLERIDAACDELGMSWDELQRFLTEEDVPPFEVYG